MSQLGGVVISGVRRSKTTEQSKDEKGGEDNDADLAQDGLASTKLGPLSATLTDVALDLIVSELVVNHAQESDGVTEELKTGDLSAPDYHGSTDKHDILKDTAKGKNDGRGLANLETLLVEFHLLRGSTRTYQEHNGNVEHEGAKTVEEEGEETNVVDLLHGASGNLPDQGNNTVHDGADGSKVVQRDEGVHLVVGGAQKSLDHGQSESLKDDTTNLEQDTSQDEVNLAEGGNDDTDDNGGDIEELPQVGRGDTKSPTREEDSDGSGGLEHLDESDGKIQVCQISENQT